MDIIDALPESWKPIAIIVMEIIVVVAAAVAVLKPTLVKYIGEPGSNDPQWKRAIFFALRVLDIVALNSATVKARKELNQTRTALNSMRPMRPVVPGNDQ